MIDDKSISEEDLLSFGLTNNLKRRVSEHKKNYKNFKLLFVYKVQNNLMIENEIKKFNKIKRDSILKNETIRKKVNRLRDVSINGIVSREHLALDYKVYTIEYFNEMILNIIKQYEYTPENHIILINKYQDLETEFSILQRKYTTLEKEHLKLKQDFETYKPVLSQDEKKLIKNQNICSTETSIGYILFIFKCNLINRYKTGFCRIDAFEQTKETLLKIDTDGEMI